MTLIGLEGALVDRIGSRRVSTVAEDLGRFELNGVLGALEANADVRVGPERGRLWSVEDPAVERGAGAHEAFEVGVFGRLDMGSYGTRINIGL